MKRKSGCGTWILMIMLIGLFAYGLSWAGNRVDRMRFPWGYPAPGKKTLAGTWAGTLVSGRGQRLGMLVEMELAPLDRGHRRNAPVIRTQRSRWLEGRVLVCARPGRIQRFTAWGEPEDTKAASRFRLALTPSDSVPLDGLSPSHIRGRWSGGDAIDLAISLHMRQGKSAITSSADPDTKGETPATLQRGTEADFTAICNRLR